MARVSATQIGRTIGASAQEVNRALKVLGFLSGTPGNYNITIPGKNVGVQEIFLNQKHIENTFKWDEELAPVIKSIIAKMRKN